MIPRRLIHVYSAPPGKPADLPLRCRAAVAGARALHPDFEHVLFGSAEMAAFLAREFPHYQEVFDAFPLPIQRFDFFRYLAVYRLGGFYLDLDVYLAQSLEPLLACDCVFPFEELTINPFLWREHRLDWELANYAFGAAPGDPFLAALIENCVRGVREPQWAARMMRGIPHLLQGQFQAPLATGPGLVSRTFAERTELQAGVTVLSPPDVCCQTDWQCFGNFGVHLMQSSWRKQEGFLRSRLARLWENRQRATGLKRSLALGPTRKGPWRTFFPPTTAGIPA
jgi:inositol phosphorylceramide mannosyltransferase catalytic subunit